ncbi:hypothetical protein BC833DRAFT_598553 [Globomyces pollinis-pini]|nr:hypothetical protein BC833DRAFT_598553 [Globomyces pollinis-pini]
MSLDVQSVATGPSFSQYSWQGYNRIGGPVNQIVSGVYQNGSGVLVSLGSKNDVYYKNQLLNGSWHTWKPLGGFAKQVQVVKNADDTLEIFYLGGLNANDSRQDSLYSCSQTTVNSSWSSWELVDQNIQEFTIALNRLSTLTAFAVLVDGTTAYRTRNIAKIWGPWKGINSESPLHGISTGYNKDGYLHLFGVGLDGNVYHASETGLFGTAVNWYDKGSALGSNIVKVSASLHSDGILMVIALDKFDQFQVKSQWAPNNGDLGWTPWRRYNMWNDNIDAIDFTTDNGFNSDMVVFAITTDSLLRFTWATMNGAFAKWTTFSNVLPNSEFKPNQITTVCRKVGNCSVIIIGDNDRVYEMVGTQIAEKQTGPDYPATYCWMDFTNTLLCGQQV